MAKVRDARRESLEDEVQSALKWLKSHSTKATLDGMARYAIPSDKAFGVAYRDMKLLGKRLGTNHELAAALWGTGVYEARMVASFVDDPSQVTPAQMDRWCKDFDNWGICDTMCFNLFDRTPHAWAKVTQWSSSKDEFVKRTAFALLWSLSVHDKRAGNEPFVKGLVLVQRAAGDERNFVKKAVNMALRAIGKRNRALNAAAVTVARRLAHSPNAVARWVGKDALSELTSPASGKLSTGSQFGVMQSSGIDLKAGSETVRPLTMRYAPKISFSVESGSVTVRCPRATTAFCLGTDTSISLKIFSLIGKLNRDSGDEGCRQNVEFGRSA